MNCKMNQGERKDLPQKCSPEELLAIRLVVNKMNVAAQAARPDSIPNRMVSFETMKEDEILFNKRKVEFFVKGALILKAETVLLESEWWREQKVKYSLPEDRPVFIDMNTGQFYIVEKKEHGQR